MSGTEKKDGELKNNLRAIRQRLGLGQAELALAAGVARQTIGGIEAGQFAASAAVALKLAKTLGCRVEEIFWLEDAPQTLLAARAESSKAPLRNERVLDERVLVGRVGERWIAHPLQGEAAFRSEMIPADGLANRQANGQRNNFEVQLLDSLESLSRTVFIAACSPAVSLWTRSAQRWHPGLRPTWVHANSSEALATLGRGEVHLAGIHLGDADKGEDNTAFVRKLVPSGPLVFINFGIWEEGLLVRRGNPWRIEGVADLMNQNRRFVNRERGAGSRILFDEMLLQKSMFGYHINGYSNEVSSHQAVAQTIARGEADAGMGTAAMAQLFELDFLPVRRVRFDFALRPDTLDEEPVKQLFETLSHRSVRLQLEKLGGYDTSRIGEVVARI